MANLTTAGLPAFNVLIKRDDDAQVWSAHCLEMDLVEDGENKFEALFGLFQNMAAQIRECEEAGIHYMHPAPAEYYAELERAIPLSIEDVEADRTWPNIPLHLALREIKNGPSNSYPSF